MLLMHQEVFDEIITGTASTWLTSSEFNGLIGSADWLRIFAVATDVSGTPTLEVYVDTSGDNTHWDEPATALLTAALTTDPVATAQQGGILNLSGMLSAFARLRIKMTGGGTPQCRLKLTVTGRVA